MPVTVAPLPDVSSLDDADLLEFIAMRADEPAFGRAAFNALYLRQAPRLRQALSTFDNLLGGALQRDDVVQEVFGRVLEKAHTFSHDRGTAPDAHRHVAAWLMAIARHIVIDGTDAQTGPFPPSFDPPDPVPDATPMTPLHRAYLRRLRDCVSVLPPRQREAVLLSYAEYVGDSTRLPDGAPERIAQRLDTTVPNLRQLRSRAERALRACCADD